MTTTPPERPADVEKWPVPENRASAGEVSLAFPFPAYRPNQREVLERTAELLYGENETETVVIDAPTGVGKSAINTALCRLARGAFYTTPQKALREQLYDDDDLQSHLHALRGRRDYQCAEGKRRLGESVSCKECPVNRKDEPSCADYVPQCRYWTAKEKAFEERAVALTFAYLIVDDYIPETVPVGSGTAGQSTLGELEERQISFKRRELLVVDEAHQLEEQTASLHVGFTLSPRTLQQGGAKKAINNTADIDIETPYDAFHDDLEDRLKHMPRGYEPAPADLVGAAESAALAAEKWEETMKACGPPQYPSYDGTKRQVRRLSEGLKAGDDWVVSVDRRERTEGQRDVYAVEFKPVEVDRFLKNHVWSRADKVVLSTATLPFRNDPNKWLRRLGLEPDTAEVVSADMPFPVENRQVYLGDAVGELSSGGFNRQFDEIVWTLSELCDHHDGANGLVHTVSYDRAARLADALGDRALAHSRETDGKVALAEWQAADDTPILCTPSMMDGVDLVGDKCRWQALAKVPYPNIGDKRVECLVNERGEWDWYNDVTARRLIQSVGRAVRSADDYAAYHVLDECFGDVIRNRAPDWFVDAIETDSVLS